MMIIAGGRTIESLYMGPALMRLARFPNVRIVPICSTPQSLSKAVLLGRPTDYLTRLLPTDVVYVCGAPAMVESVRSIASRFGAACYADPFLPPTDDTVEKSVLSRALGWLAAPTAAMRERIALAGRQKRQLALEAPRKRREQPVQAYRLRREPPMQAHRIMAEAEARMRNHYGPQTA